MKTAVAVFCAGLLIFSLLLQVEGVLVAPCPACTKVC